MEKKEFTNERLDNKEEGREKGIVEGTKKSLNKLFSAMLIAGMISGTAVARETLNGYDEVKELTDKMEEGENLKQIIE